MGTYAWGAYGQQGDERERREQELAKRQQERRQQITEWRARIPAWEDGIRQTDVLLEEARARLAEAQAEGAAAWDALEQAAFMAQRGECAFSAEGLPVLDANRPEVAGQKARWDEAQEREGRALRRVTKLEAQREHFAGLIGTARTMT